MDVLQPCHVESGTHPAFTRHSPGVHQALTRRLPSTYQVTPVQYHCAWLPRPSFLYWSFDVDWFDSHPSGAGSTHQMLALFVRCWLDTSTMFSKAHIQWPANPVYLAELVGGTRWYLMVHDGIWWYMMVLCHAAWYYSMLFKAMPLGIIRCHAIQRHLIKTRDQKAIAGKQLKGDERDMDWQVHDSGGDYCLAATFKWSFPLVHGEGMTWS